MQDGNSDIHCEAIAAIELNVPAKNATLLPSKWETPGEFQ